MSESDAFSSYMLCPTFIEFPLLTWPQSSGTVCLPLCKTLTTLLHLRLFSELNFLTLRTQSDTYTLVPVIHLTTQSAEQINN